MEYDSCGFNQNDFGTYIFKINEGVVDGDDLNFRMLKSSTEDETTDTTKTVNSNLYGK